MSKDILKGDSRPPMTDEDRENQLINLSMNLAEKKLLDGTASSQLICHFLKLGTEKEQLEVEKTRKENLLLEAKTEAIKQGGHIEELIKDAMGAFGIYSGGGSVNGTKEL